MLVKYQSLKKKNVINIINIKFIILKYDKYIKPLYLERSQMTGYINKFNEHKNKNTTTMSLKVKDKNFFKNCNKIW